MMPDKYINATKLVYKLKHVCINSRLADEAWNPIYAGTEMEIKVRDIYKSMIGILENEQAADVVPRPAPNWPICQHCGQPMVYCGEEKTDDIVWKHYSCKNCYNQSCARKIVDGEEQWPRKTGEE